ncbi:MAG: hypothetical protein WCQ99_10785, partial [Pseudomonadota bacterium]
VYSSFIIEHLEEGGIICYILDRCSLCNGACVIIDDMLYELKEGEGFFGLAETILFQKVIDRIARYFILHAGVVSKNGDGYIIYAPTGFGKTTLVMELVSRGYKFLSDEYCPVDIKNLFIKPFLRKIGIKNNSPFKNKLSSQKSLYVKYGDKYYTDCADIFPCSTGTDCRAKYLIMLTNDIHFNSDSDDDKNRKYELTLFDDTKGIIEKISQFAGVKVLNKDQQHFYTTYIFSMPRDKQLMNNIYTVLKLYGEYIFFIAPINEKKTAFANSPNIVKMNKSEAVFELLTNLVNRAPSSKLLEKCDGKTMKMFMKVGEFIKDVDCYYMTTGKLHEMASLIDNL